MRSTKKTVSLFQSHVSKHEFFLFPLNSITMTMNFTIYIEIVAITRAIVNNQEILEYFFIWKSPTIFLNPLFPWELRPLKPHFHLQ